jgi:hypothetical protein
VGLHIERVEVKDISLPESMKRSMSRQAEAERERHARVISADGEFQASARLAGAAHAMAATPGALQLRLLQTVVDVAAEKNSPGDALPRGTAPVLRPRHHQHRPRNPGGPRDPGPSDNSHRIHHDTTYHRDRRARLTRGTEPLQRRPLLTTPTSSNIGNT